MPAPYDAIYMLLDLQTYGGQRMINRYFFGSELVGTPSANDLALEFAATMLPLITACQTDTLIHTNIRCVNVSDVLDYVDLVINVPGDDESDGMPPASPVGFRATQPGYGLRPASKRISGFLEVWQVDGVVNTSVGQLQALAAALGTPLETDDAIYYPVTVSVPTPFVPPLPVVPTNRDAINWSIRPYVSTQTSRRQTLG